MRIVLQITIPTLISCLVAAGCASGPKQPGFYFAKHGITATTYEQDVAACAQRGRQAMTDYGKQPTSAPGATGINYHDKKYGAAPGIAAQGTYAFAAGLEQGRAKRRAEDEAIMACMREKGYGEVQLTQAEGDAFGALSKDEQKAQFARWATGQQRSANSK